MPENTGERRRLAVIWGSAAVAAVVLVLAVNGTLSDWTQAIIGNDHNTVQAKSSVVLTETDGSHTCASTDTGDGSNSFTCSTIDKYGGTAAPLGPGDSQTATVTMSNTGTGAGALTLAPLTCTKSAGSGTATQSICDVATVTVACTAPSALDTTATPVALSALTTQTVGTLAAGDATACTFTVALPSDASPQIGGQIATQALKWTLTATP